MTGRILWKIPEPWRSPTLGQRTLLYPAIYMKAAGLDVTIERSPDRQALEDAGAFILTIDGILSEADRELLQIAKSQGKPVLVAPGGGVGRQTLAETDEARAVLAIPMDKGPLRSAFPPIAASRVSVAGCVARSAEDRLLLDALGLPRGDEARPPKGKYLLVAAQSAEAVLEIAPVLSRAVEEHGLALVLTGDGADSDELSSLGIATTFLPADSPAVLPTLSQAAILFCAFPSAPATSAIPGAWTRTALFHGVPVVAASHPSIDGLAHVCVLDDWERGLALYRHERARLRAGVRAHQAVAELVSPTRVIKQWEDALKVAGQVAAKPPPARSFHPTLMVMFDLGQDFELLLPILLALRERQVVKLRIVVTDWLQADSPRTLDGLAAAGFEIEIIDRSAARGGEAPSVEGIDAVLTASDTTAGPHRAAHSLSQRAAAKGVPSFTLQHGLENVGLTYRGGTYTDEIEFGADRVFIWGPAADLPDWTPKATREKALAVGNPKRTPPPSIKLRIDDRPWRKTVGVFENLHWDRFDDDFRQAFLDDLAGAAAANPDVLFVVKPHHAGRWLIKHPEALPIAPNLTMLDPMNPAWQPYTAPVLVASMDAVITTPSTVAIDAARAGRSVAVAGYSLELGLYAPLPILRSRGDWDAYLNESGPGHILRNEEFLARVLLPGRADHRIAAEIEQTLRTRWKTPAIAA